jgi:hypothetical protein
VLGTTLLEEWDDDMDIQAWYTRTSIYTRIKSKVVPLLYHSIIIRE